MWKLLCMYVNDISIFSSGTIRAANVVFFQLHRFAASSLDFFSVSRPISQYTGRSLYEYTERDAMAKL